jgi:hypothetical protein
MGDRAGRVAPSHPQRCRDPVRGSNSSLQSGIALAQSGEREGIPRGAGRVTERPTSACLFGVRTAEKHSPRGGEVAERLESRWHPRSEAGEVLKSESQCGERSVGHLY